MNIHKNRLSFLNPKSFIRENGGYHHRFLLYGHKHVRQKSSLSSQIKQKNQFFQDYPLSHGASKSQSLKSIELFWRRLWLFYKTDANYRYFGGLIDFRVGFKPTRQKCYRFRLQRFCAIFKKLFLRAQYLVIRCRFPRNTSHVFIIFEDQVIIIFYF